MAYAITSIDKNGKVTQTYTNDASKAGTSDARTGVTTPYSGKTSTPSTSSVSTPKTNTSSAKSSVNSSYNNSISGIDKSGLSGYALMYANALDMGANDEEAHQTATYFNGGSGLTKDYIDRLASSGLGVGNQQYNQNGFLVNQYDNDQNPIKIYFDELQRQQALLEQQALIEEQGLLQDEVVDYNGGGGASYSDGGFSANGNGGQPSYQDTLFGNVNNKNSGGYIGIGADRYSAINRYLARDMWKDRM